MNRAELERLADALVAHTRKRPEQFYEWSNLAAFFDVEREQLEQAIRIAADWDYKLRVRKNRGVAFVSAPDVLTATEIAHHLKTKWLGQSLFSYRSAKSTNDLAVQMAASGALEGSVITAEEQTRGRGRLGRTWHSPTGTGIYVSVIVRPALRPEDAPGISVMTAVALADSICKYSPGKVQLKWPNDVLINGRKTAGILTELSAERNRINHLIIGVGINANQRAGDFPTELRRTATSLRRELKRKVRRVELLQSFLQNLEKEYESYLKYRLKKAHSKIRRYSSLVGKQVTLQSGRSLITGLATDIDRTGCLILKTDDGTRAVTAGEVTVVKE
jgi:BirA family biotin operon repressor/biotin-[acetyl-CoA-carboxylase] ligase